MLYVESVSISLLLVPERTKNLFRFLKDLLPYLEVSQLFQVLLPGLLLVNQNVLSEQEVHHTLLIISHRLYEGCNTVHILA